MIEFEGMIPLPANATTAQLLVLLTEVMDRAEMIAGTALNDAKADDLVLQEPPHERGDEWIPSLLSDASSHAVPAGMLSPGEVDLLDPQSTDDEEEQEIVVTGDPYSGRSYTWDGGSGGSGATGGGHSGHSGNGGGGGSAAPVEQHAQDCGTKDGAAVQVAKHVKGELPSGVSGPPDPVTTSSGNDWTKVEFGAVIVRNPDGSFGALNNMIYSSNQATYAALPASSGHPVQGIWHSHPLRGGVEQQAIDRYPSPGDWASLARIGGQAGAAADPSIWLMGPDGITREFRLSERSTFENLSADQMKQGQGLPGRERAQSCG